MEKLLLDFTTSGNTWQSVARAAVTYLAVGEGPIQLCRVGVGGGFSRQARVDHKTERFNRALFANTLVTSEFVSFPNLFKLITKRKRIQLLCLNCTCTTSPTSFYQLRGNRARGVFLVFAEYLRPV